MNRFLDGEVGNKKLPAIGAYWQHALLPLEQALAPVIDRIDGLDRSIKEAKKRCHYPSEHQLTKEESAAIYLYSMEGGDYSFYRVLNEALRSENRRALCSWFGFLKLLDTALSKLPIVRQAVWRGISGNISQQFKKGEILTWWSISSCSLELEVVKDFLGSNMNATLLMIETKNAKDISRYSSLPDEKEVLLGPGTELRVQSNALHRGDLHIVHLIEVHDRSSSNDTGCMKLPSKPKGIGTSAVLEQRAQHFPVYALDRMASPSASAMPIANILSTMGLHSHPHLQDDKLQEILKSFRIKHFVCQQPGCNNRCNDFCGPLNTYGIGSTRHCDHRIATLSRKCDKCDREGYRYKCLRCDHIFCRNCCLSE